MAEQRKIMISDERAVTGASAVSRLGDRLASPRLTVAFFVLTAAGAYSAKEHWLPPTYAVLAPLILLVLNLVAAIALHPRFRADLPLLIFHLALLVLVVLFGVGRMTYLYGSISVTRDTPFNGIIDKLDVGPWHPGAHDRLAFEHVRLEERFNDSVGHHVDIRSTVRWLDGTGWRQAELAFGYPVIVGGYRVYPSGRRGYTPIFHWKGKDGREELGAVQLFGPAESVMENTNDWVMPDGTPAWLQLEKEDKAPPVSGTVRENLGSAGLQHGLVLRIGDARYQLDPGGQAVVPGGVLTYVGLESWAGYSLIYDPTEPWLIATILVAIGSLASFYARRFARQRLPENTA